MAIDNKCAYKISDNKCAILKQKKCTHCHFYLTKKELAEKKKRSEERLNKRFTKSERKALEDKYK